MIIKIRKRLYIKPHFCRDCGKFTLIGRHPKSYRCKRCHMKHLRRRKTGKQKYNHTYQVKRARAIKRHPYCSLCGSKDHLTCHHVCDKQSGEWLWGGVTVLCRECHQLYEREVNKIRSNRRIIIKGDR